MGPLQSLLWAAKAAGAERIALHNYRGAKVLAPGEATGTWMHHSHVLSELLTPLALLPHHPPISAGA